MAVTVTTEQVAERVPKGSHGSTFAGNPLACAAAAATLSCLLQDDLLARSTAVGTHLLEQLRSADLRGVREVRGSGLMIAVELRRPATPVLRSMQAMGVLALPAARNVVRLLPSLLLDTSHVDELVSVLQRALSSQAG